MIMNIVGALLLTYFVSRATRKVPLPVRGVPALVIAHLASLALIGALVFALRFPINVFRVDQLQIYIVPQLLWLALDYLRRQQQKASA